MVGNCISCSVLIQAHKVILEGGKEKSLNPVGLFCEREVFFEALESFDVYKLSNKTFVDSINTRQFSYSDMSTV